MNLSSLLLSTILAFITVPIRGCGRFGFFEWIDLPEDIKDAAMALGYSEENWDDIHTNPVEYLKFSDLTSTKAGTEVETVFGTYKSRTDDIEGVLMDLDVFNENCWDFFVNHYDGYTWAELEETYNPFGDNVQEIVTALGWDEMMWDDTTFEGPIPESGCKFWTTLDPVEKWAFSSLGWNGIFFDLSPCDPRCPKSPACPLN